MAKNEKKPASKVMGKGKAPIVLTAKMSGKSEKKKGKK